MTNSIPMTATIKLEDSDFSEFTKHFLEDWQKRMLADKDESEVLGFTIGCPFGMLQEQLEAMKRYRDFLEMRMALSGITIPE